MTIHDGDGFVLDLSDVPFMDCAGLGTVVHAHNSLAERLCLTAPQPRVMRLLELTGVRPTLRILPIGDLWPTEADARRCHVLLDRTGPHRMP
jgi:anti-anti-sigma factor